MPQIQQHNPQLGAPAKDPSRVKKGKKSSPSTSCKSSYMLPTKSERRRHHSSASRPNIAAPNKRQSTAKSKQPLYKKPPGTRNASKKHGNTSPSPSTLLFPKKHSAARLRSVNNCSIRYPTTVNNTGIDIAHISTFDDKIDEDEHDSANEVDIVSGGDFVASPRLVEVDPLETLEDICSASLLSGEYRSIQPQVSTPALKSVLQEVARSNISLGNEISSPFSSKAQLVRQCAQCKILYQTSHTCSMTNHSPNSMRRPRTAPAARTAGPQRSPEKNMEQDNITRSHRELKAQRNKTLPPRPASSNSIRKNLPVGAFSGNRQLLRNRPTTAGACGNALTRSIADSFAFSGENSVRAAGNNMKYDYGAIGSRGGSRRPKSASSLWRHRPSSNLCVLEL
mmetsp:Transcript_7349/g.13900  ORF Transcript_7349/g.13900 Transcript_7349/m.13900 type:complete len:395 (-) Transcript_7349:1490-2674(-)